MAVAAAAGVESLWPVRRDAGGGVLTSHFLAVAFGGVGRGVPYFWG